MAIIYELQRAFREGKDTLAYAELKRRVGVRDSGNFNYHLQRLVGQYVRKTDVGYALTYAGRKVASALTAGIFTEQADGTTVLASGTCYNCHAESLTARYERERICIACDDCDEEILHNPFPPAPTTRREDLLFAFDAWTRRWNALASAGTCPECGSRMDGKLTDSNSALSVGDVPYRLHVTCRECWAMSNLPLGLLVRDHPQVVGLHTARDVDIGSTPSWDIDWALHRDYLAVVSDDPLTLQLRIPLDDEELQLTFDDEGTVVSTEITH
ncbi:winged helix-turn-helix domain-containing protein [Haladaptatus pallidirubidus]|uniref:Winged helix-turn-helix domain-containing protein n=1 Tax=Haladaptatus pallidirubidus TaxID=1008152 RepID=A0AAV3UFW6_9EURY